MKKIIALLVGFPFPVQIQQKTTFSKEVLSETLLATDGSRAASRISANKFTHVHRVPAKRFRRRYTTVPPAQTSGSAKFCRFTRMYRRRAKWDAIINDGHMKITRAETISHDTCSAATPIKRWGLIGLTTWLFTPFAELHEE
jgi:hypothetical protein